MYVYENLYTNLNIKPTSNTPELINFSFFNEAFSSFVAILKITSK